MAGRGPKQGSGWSPVKTTVSRGGRFLRVGDVPSKFGGQKLGRILPAGYNGIFLRLLRR